MDIHETNSVIKRAIISIQEKELENTVEAVASGKSSYRVPRPDKEGMPSKYKVPSPKSFGFEKESPPNLNKIKKLAKHFQNVIDEHYKDFPVKGYARKQALVTVIKKRKYVLIDQGSSGWLIVGPNDEVWGIKGYGRPNKGHYKGTVDDILKKGGTFNVGGSPVKFPPA